MALWQAVLLGAIQGATEFIPVSSTAHLFLVQRWLGLGNGAADLSFDIVLHLGTAIALVIVFRGEIFGMAGEVVRGVLRKPAFHPEERALLPPLLVGTIPGGLAGIFLLKRFEQMRTVLAVGLSMLAACVVFFLAEAVAQARRRRGAERTAVSLVDAAWIGLAQAVAGLLAGFSRSGLTISAGLFRGLSRERAARFSFLLALPIILGAGAKTLLDLRRHPEPVLSGPVLAAGLFSSAVVGILAVRFLLSYLKTHSLRPFGIYLGLLGAALVGYSLLG
jgi:undecaprenyl-diphosphatase